MPVRLSDREYRALMNKPEVREAMRLRCEETNHDYEGAMSLTFQIWHECKWCGERR